MKKILCICFSSTFQRSINFRNISLNQVNRSESYLKYASGKAINSARVLEQLESNCVKCFCPLGEKDFSAFIELAKKDNLKIEYTLIPGNTRECWTLLDRENHTTTELVVSEPFIKKSEEITSINFLRDGYIIDSYTTNVELGGEFTKTFSYPIEITTPMSNTYFQVRTMDKKGSVVVANTTALNFYYPYYYGIVEEDATIDSYLIQEVLNKQIDVKSNKTYTFSPRNQRIVIAYPSEYGMLKSILDPNGFEQIASFNRVEIEMPCLDNTMQMYYVYYNKPSTNKNFRMSFYY